MHDNQGKVKKYIAERNAREGTTGSSSGDTEASPATTTKVPVDDNSSAPADKVAQDMVDN